MSIIQHINNGLIFIEEDIIFFTLLPLLLLFILLLHYYFQSTFSDACPKRLSMLSRKDPTAFVKILQKIKLLDQLSLDSKRIQRESQRVNFGELRYGENRKIQLREFNHQSFEESVQDSKDRIKADRRRKLRKSRRSLAVDSLKFPVLPTIEEQIQY